jgi:hypothetical protein
MAGRSFLLPARAYIRAPARGPHGRVIKTLRAAIALRVAMAAAERIDLGCLAHVLQLTLLAPDIVEAILDGRWPTDLGLPGLMEPLPAEWSEQGQALLTTRPAFRCVRDQPLAGGRCIERR